MLIPPLCGEASQDDSQDPLRLWTRTPARRRIYGGESRADWPAPYWNLPFSLPRPPQASPLSPLPAPRHPPPPTPASRSDPALRVGWPRPQWTREAAEPPRPPSLGQPDHCFGRKCQGSLKIQLGPRTCLRLRESDPVPGAACPRGFWTEKASYLQPEPSELLGMPSPTAKTWRSSSVSISII